MESGELFSGRYQLVELLGRGGFGEVWARFDRDATVGARVRHPGLAVVRATDRDGERAFTVGEPVDGDDLHGVLARSTGGLPLGEALPLSRRLADALGAAHGDSVAHLGLTWRNVLRRRSGLVAVCDFGTTGAGPGPGDIGGWGLFTAPEQWRRDRAGARADLYALGCLLYALFTARPPFRGPGPKELGHRHLTQEAPLLPSVRPAVPPALEELASRLLAEEPGGRPSVDEAKDVLTRLARDGSASAPDGEGPRWGAPVDAAPGAPYGAVGARWPMGRHRGVDSPRALRHDRPGRCRGDRGLGRAGAGPTDTRSCSGTPTASTAGTRT
ncbi:protein kinase [Streptomyces sp. NPDC058646]|uniref:protein kinase domain-containing protein n=1 Tax=Streptomyces sp. NPDC058646 TaxID=3346574 RepID=UPI00364ECB9A